MTSTGTSAPVRLDHRRARRRIIGFWLMLALALGALLGQVPEPAAAATCPCSIFTAGQTPTNPAENDTDAVELGVKFRADQAGFVTGIRFYKGDGQHRHAHRLAVDRRRRPAGHRHVHRRDRHRLAAGDSSPPRSPSPPTRPTSASYYAPVGRYAADDGYFAASGVTNSPLTALAERRRRRQRRLPVRQRRRLPQQQLPVDQLLGRRGVRDRRGGHHQAHRDRSPAPRPAPPACRHRHDRHRHLQRGGRPPPAP